MSRCSGLLHSPTPAKSVTSATHGTVKGLKPSARNAKSAKAVDSDLAARQDFEASGSGAPALSH